VVRGLVASDSQMDHFFTWGNMAVAMLLRLRFWDGKFLGPAGLTDVGCTFRAIRRDALERILPDLQVGGNHFSPHMLMVAMANGLSVVEIPIRFRRRVGQSKGGSQSLRKGLEVGLAMIWDILTFAPKNAEGSGVFVERDGIIVRHRKSDRDNAVVEFVPGAADGLAMLSRHGHKVIVVADDSGRDVSATPRSMDRAVNARIAAEVEHRGGRVDSFVVCSHAPAAGCSCRGPQPNLLINAARRSPIDLSRSVVLSDRPTFLRAAASVGCETILIGDVSGDEDAVDRRALDLPGAVELVLATKATASEAPELQTVS